VRETATQDTPESIPNLLIGGIRFYVEYGLRRQDHATEAKTTLGGPLLNKGLLYGVRLFRSAQARERRDFVLTDATYRHDTRPHDFAAHDYGAGSALRHATSESGSAQPKLVAQNKQQRRFWINRHDVRVTIHMQGDLVHRNEVAPWLFVRDRISSTPIIRERSVEMWRHRAHFLWGTSDPYSL
jgi:hypothetical protein